MDLAAPPRPHLVSRNRGTRAHLIAAVVLILMQVVFLVVSDWMPYNDVRV